MKNQLVLFANWLFGIVFDLLSKPQQVRRIMVAVGVCLLVAALVIPSLYLLAASLPGGGGH